MAPRHGSVETTANQITFDFVLEKRRFGKSTIAQNVGIMGISTIPISINKFNGLKAILQLHAILDAGSSCFSLTAGCRSQAISFSGNL
ncbi:MAG: hypothetical protein WAN11_16765 [Syntrophobacteraceae bacterium]